MSSFAEVSGMALPVEREEQPSVPDPMKPTKQASQKRHVPSLAIVIGLAITIAVVISVVVYLFALNRRKIADQVAMRSTLQTTADMLAVKLSSEIGLGSDASFMDNVYKSYDVSRVADSGRVMTVEVLDPQNGRLYASSLRPSWATSDSGTRPGRSIFGGMDDGTGGGLQKRVDQAVASGGGFVSFQFINPVTGQMNMRDTFVAPVPASDLCIMVGIDV